jgi:hypothetical protein
VVFLGPKHGYFTNGFTRARGSARDMEGAIEIHCTPDEITLDQMMRLIPRVFFLGFKTWLFYKYAGQRIGQRYGRSIEIHCTPDEITVRSIR